MRLISLQRPAAHQKGISKALSVSSSGRSIASVLAKRTRRPRVTLSLAYSGHPGLEEAAPCAAETLDLAQLR